MYGLRYGTCSYVALLILSYSQSTCMVCVMVFDGYDINDTA